MASKSNRARQAAAKAKTRSAWPVILLVIVAADVGYLQNRYGQLSDIRSFYGIRFADGTHQWAYEPQVRAEGSTLLLIEYPVITGVAIWCLNSLHLYQKFYFLTTS